MGHLIEYLISVPEPDIRSWLDRLPGFYCTEADDPTKDWEGELAGGGAFWARIR